MQAAYETSKQFTRIAEDLLGIEQTKPGSDAMTVGVAELGWKCAAVVSARVASASCMAR
jgi:hypothetical protein